MLRELTISALGVIDAATVEFAEGLTALTGETGAGKTMVTTGIGLLLGDRAESGLVRHGARHARVEGRFAAPARLQPQLLELGVEDDEGELLVARQVSDQGRSRAWAGGVQIPAGVLARITGEMVTIHGQSEQVRLGSSERQRDVLDRFCGAAHLAALSNYRARFARRRVLADELGALRRTGLERARQADLLRFGCDEIAAADPQPGEDLRLQEEARRLQSVDELRTVAARLGSALSGGPEHGDSSDVAIGAVGLVGVARKAGDQLAQLDERADPLASQLHELAALANDVSADVARYEADLDVDPARLDAVMERQSELTRLTRKYGNTVDEVLEWARESAERLVDLEGTDDRILTLQAELDALEIDLRSRATHLGQTRREGAHRLEHLVTSELAALALPHARIMFALEPTLELGPHGTEQVTVAFSANPGSAPGPLGRVASGGELSRVRLALEVSLAASDPGHTFIFDEIDAGVGGAVALEVGRRLSRLARHSQVVVVTHLAQVAAFADRQVVVAKSSDGQVTTSGLHAVDGAAREQELARMMGGLESADSARAHARELLQTAQARTSARS